MLRPALNSKPIEIYKISTSAELHDYRNRLEDEDSAYELLQEIDAQVYFYSKEKLAFLEGVGIPKSLGYVYIRTEDANTLGILPEEDEWVKFRIKFTDLGDSYYNITEVKPVCYLKSSGNWLFREVCFDKVITGTVLSTESPSAEENMGAGSILETYTEFEEDTYLEV